MRVTSKGQVTIPKPIRDRAGIQPGTEVEFVFRNGELVLKRREERQALADRRAREFRDFLESIRGMANSRLTADEIMEMTRGPHNDLDDR